MKVAKWICRYLFFAVILAGTICWWGYCSNTVAQLNETIGSAEYIDMASSLSTDALMLLERLEQYQQLRTDALKLILIVGGCLLVLILWHVGSEVVIKKLAQRPAKELKPKKDPKPKKKPVQKPVAPAQPVNSLSEPVSTVAESVEVVSPPAPKGGYCTECGQYYEDFPAFCRKCGNKLK